MSAENCGTSESWAEFRRGAARLTTRHEAALSAERDLSAGLLLLLLTASAFPLYYTSVTRSPSEVSSSHSQRRLLLRWLTTQCVKRLYHNREGTGGATPPHPPFSTCHLPAKAVGLSGRTVALFVKLADLCERTRPGCIYEPCNYCCRKRALMLQLTCT